jgi:hypothetical protein
MSHTLTWVLAMLALAWLTFRWRYRRRAMRRLPDISDEGGPSIVVTYWVILTVTLHSPLTLHEPATDEEAVPVIGYVRFYGVTAASEAEATALAASEVENGEIDWARSRVSIVIAERLDPAILARSEDRSKVGVWYRGGRIFYPADDDEKAS